MPPVHPLPTTPYIQLRDSCRANTDDRLVACPLMLGLQLHSCARLSPSEYDALDKIQLPRQRYYTPNVALADVCLLLNSWQIPPNLLVSS